MWEVDSEPTQREHLVDVIDESSRSSPPPPPAAHYIEDDELIVSSNREGWLLHGQNETRESKLINGVIDDASFSSDDIVPVSEGFSHQDYNIDIAADVRDELIENIVDNEEDKIEDVSEEVIEENYVDINVAAADVSDEVLEDNVLIDDGDIVIHTDEKVDVNDDRIDDIVSVDEPVDDKVEDSKQSVEENDRETDHYSDNLDKLISYVEEQVRQEKSSDSGSEGSDSNFESVKDSTLQSSVLDEDRREESSLESSWKESYWAPPSPQIYYPNESTNARVNEESNHVEQESDHNNSTDDNTPVFANESDKSDTSKSLDNLVINTNSGSHSPASTSPSSHLYSPNYKSGERSPTSRLYSRTYSSGYSSPKSPYYSLPPYRSSSRSSGGGLFSPVFASGLQSRSLQFFPEDRRSLTNGRKSEFLDSFSSTKSSPAQVNQSAVLHGRFAGSFDERIIGKTEKETKVYSERPGGWEHTRNELVYPLSKDEWRREARRRKFYGKTTTKEDDVVSFIITVSRKSSQEHGDDFCTTLQHKTTAVADQSVPFAKGTDDNVTSISFGSSPNIYGRSDEIMLRMDDDKRSLVERSESFEAPTSPATLVDKNKLMKSKSLDVSTNYPVYAQNQSFEDSENMNLDYSKGVDSSAARRENFSTVRQPKSSVWGNRVNPFDEEPVSDDLFTSGIIDLDYDEKETHDAELVDSDSSEGSTHESKLRKLSRSSLSEQEEQINLKTQFKGVYYNIGSTEDLLQDLAADDDKEGDLGIPASHRYLGSKQSSSDESEVSKDHFVSNDTKTETEAEAEPEAAPPVPAPPQPRLKGRDPDSAPLINQGDTDDKENMPLFGKKKKPAEPEIKDGETLKMENGGVESTNGSVENKADEDKEKAMTESDGSGVTVEKKEIDGNVAVTFTAGVTNDPKEEVKEEGVQPASAETNQSPPTKTEKSPLIGQLEPHDPNVKDSKLRDHSPGFLCCSIL